MTPPVLFVWLDGGGDLRKRECRSETEEAEAREEIGDNKHYAIRIPHGILVIVEDHT